MRRVFILLTLLATLVLLIMVPSTSADVSRYAGDRILVKFKGDSKPFRVIKVPAGGTVGKTIAQYQRKRNVVRAEPDYIATAFMTPSDPFYGYQWNFDNPAYGGINAETAWDSGSGAGTVIAVIDSGVAYENYSVYARAPDLAQTIFVPGYDFVNNDPHPNDDSGHGTHVTGTLAQSTNNGTGVAGLAYSASVMPVKVLNSRGTGYYSDISAGIRFAADNGAKVINLSLGGSSDSGTLRDAVNYAAGKGVIVVAAAGNDGSSLRKNYPAAYPAAISVTATRYDEAIASYANTGSTIDLAAPGGDLGVDQNGDGYGDGVLQQTFGRSYTRFGYYFYQGTSMATPHVAGVASILIGLGVTDPAQVRSILESTAEDHGPPGWDDDYGHGIVDAAAAVAAVAPPTPNDPPVANPGGPYSGTEDVATQFDGSLSSDPNGDSLTYRWDFGDGTSGTGVSPTHVYTAGGQYTATLVVNDGRDDSAPVTAGVTVAEVNDPPVAVAGPDQTAHINTTISFDGSGSYDVDGTIASYAWDYGNGDTGAGAIHGYAFTTAGTHTVTLTATDNAGATDIDTLVVTVTDPDAVDPAIVMSVSNIQVTYRARWGQRFQGQATVNVVDGNGNPVYGATVTGQWTGAWVGEDADRTDFSGEADLRTSRVRGSGLTFMLTITDIVKDGMTYDPGRNLETTDSITTP